MQDIQSARQRQVCHKNPQGFETHLFVILKNMFCYVIKTHRDLKRKGANIQAENNLCHKNPQGFETR